MRLEASLGSITHLQQQHRGQNVWEQIRRKQCWPENGFGSGYWEGQLKRYFSSFKMRQLGFGLVLCPGKC